MVLVMVMRATAMSRVGAKSLGLAMSHCRTIHLRPPSSTPLLVPLPIPSRLYSTSTSTSKSELLPLPRSIPHKRGLLLISVPVPPSAWPSHIELASGLIASTSAKLKSKGIGVNAIYDGVGQQQTFENDTLKGGTGEERYRARLFWADGRWKEYQQFGIDTLNSEELEEDIQYQPSTAIQETGKGKPRKGKREILVCTHGSRDCRCSDKGGPLVLALREEIKRRNLEKDVKVGEIAHVGGHKYAANALLLPTLDMLSNLDVGHAPSIISHIMGLGVGTSVSDLDPELPLWSHWRGRMGLTEDEQNQLWKKVDPSSTKPQSGSELVEGKEAVMDKVKLHFRTFQGEDKVVEADLGENLLDVGKRYDLPSLEGVCDGNLECATCHLYLFPPPTTISPSSVGSGLELPVPVPEPSEEELDMLGYALGYKDQSRLGCQITVTRDLGRWCENGGVIGLPRF